MINDLKTILSKAKDLKKELEIAKKEVCKKGKVLFNEAVALLFKENPDIKSFGWNQYTPYFNDGDTCCFGVNNHPSDITVNDICPYEDDDEDAQKSVMKYRKIISSFLRSFDDDLLEDMFGDHVHVVVTEKNIKVKTYEHD